MGGGPAGLRAAEIAAAGGAQVTLYDAKRSVGRKLLVAGKSGLNLTNDEAFEPFVERYQGPELRRDLLRSILQACDNQALRAWASGLGIETRAASSGKVFPTSMKAAPLLRAWIQRHRALGVTSAVNHELLGLQPGKPHRLLFCTPGKEVVAQADAVILALGGGSWPSTGSTGHWVIILRELGVEVASLEPANCGWELDWPAELLQEVEGQPLKNIALAAGGVSRHGELVITRYGLEGGPLYHLGPILRACEVPAVTVTLDLKPSFGLEEVEKKLGGVSSNYVREARRRLNLDPAATALLRHLPHLGPWNSPEVLAAAIKSCPLQLLRPRPLAEAISSAGGVRWSELNDGLMINQLPGVFVAGEMIDWEAPTGGYLIQGCFATGGHAAHSAMRWLESNAKP